MFKMQMGKIIICRKRLWIWTRRYLHFMSFIENCKWKCIPTNYRQS